jgi:hypothetical protein
MKSFLKIIPSFLPILLVLSSCGKDNSQPKANVAAVGVPTCQIGQVYTSQGCLQAYPGMQGYGVNSQGQPVSGAQCWSGTTMTAYGCQTNASVQSGGYGSGYQGGVYYGGYNPGTGGSAGGGQTGMSCQPYQGCSTGTVCYSPQYGYFCY